MSYPTIRHRIRKRIAELLQDVTVDGERIDVVLARASIPAVGDGPRPQVIVYPGTCTSELTSAVPVNLKQVVATFAIEGWGRFRDEDKGSFGKSREDQFDEFAGAVEAALESDPQMSGLANKGTFVSECEDILSSDEQDPDLMGFGMVLKVSWRQQVKNPHKVG